MRTKRQLVRNARFRATNAEASFFKNQDAEATTQTAKATTTRLPTTQAAKEAQVNQMRETLRNIEARQPPNNDRTKIIDLEELDPAQRKLAETLGGDFLLLDKPEKDQRFQEAFLAVVDDFLAMGTKNTSTGEFKNE